MRQKAAGRSGSPLFTMNSIFMIGHIKTPGSLNVLVRPNQNRGAKMTKIMFQILMHLNNEKSLIRIVSIKGLANYYDIIMRSKGNNSIPGHSTATKKNAEITTPFAAVIC